MSAALALVAQDTPALPRAAASGGEDAAEVLARGERLEVVEELVLEVVCERLVEADLQRDVSLRVAGERVHRLHVDRVQERRPPLVAPCQEGFEVRAPKLPLLAGELAGLVHVLVVDLLEPPLLLVLLAGALVDEVEALVQELDGFADVDDCVRDLAKDLVVAVGGVCVAAATRRAAGEERAALRGGLAALQGGIWAADGVGLGLPHLSHLSHLLLQLLNLLLRQLQLLSLLLPQLLSSSIHAFTTGGPGRWSAASGDVGPIPGPGRWGDPAGDTSGDPADDSACGTSISDALVVMVVLSD